MACEDAPYALASAAEQGQRKLLLAAPHMRLLAEFVAAMRRELGPAHPIPDFDTCDGGAYARVLILLEAPGRKAISSGFVSRNNPDPTAKNLCLKLAAAGVPREDMSVWNTILWCVGTPERIRAVTPAYLARAWLYTERLLALIPHLEMIVLLGLKAQPAAPRLRAVSSVPLLLAPHASGQVFNTRPDLRRQAREVFAQVAGLLGDPTRTCRRCIGLVQRLTNSQGSSSYSTGDPHTRLFMIRNKSASCRSPPLA